MIDVDGEDQELIIFNGSYDPIVADAVSPQSCEVAGQSLPSRAGILAARSLTEVVDDASRGRLVELAELFQCAR